MTHFIKNNIELNIESEVPLCMKDVPTVPMIEVAAFGNITVRLANDPQTLAPETL